MLEVAVHTQCNFYYDSAICTYLAFLHAFRFKYALSGGKPRVYSIGGIVDDAEKGLYWYLYLKHDQMSNGLERFDGGKI